MAVGNPTAILALVALTGGDKEGRKGGGAMGGEDEVSGGGDEAVRQRVGVADREGRKAGDHVDGEPG